MARNRQLKQNSSGSKSGRILAAVLGISLMVASPMGCGPEKMRQKQKEQSKPKVSLATTKKKPNGNGLPKECDIEMNRDEIRQIEAGFVRKCSSDEADILREGSVVSTQSGKQAKVFRIDDQGAFIAFGGNGSYSAGAYIPYGTTLNIFDPALREGKESEKVRELNEDVWMLVCPAKTQPAAKAGMSMMRVVKKTWGQLKCLIAGLRRGPEEKQKKMEEAKKKLEELKAEQDKLKKIETELRKVLERDKPPKKKIHWIQPTKKE